MPTESLTARKSDGRSRGGPVAARTGKRSRASTAASTGQTRSKRRCPTSTSNKDSAEKSCDPVVSGLESPGENSEQPYDQQGSHDIDFEKNEDGTTAGRTYFEAHKGALTTTNLTLASLSICSPEELTKSLSESHNYLFSEQEHQADKFREQYSFLEYILDAGHSILVHGFGSKRLLLDEFATSLSSMSDVVLINGFNPTVSMRAALTQIAADVLKLKSFSKRSLLDYVDAVRDKMTMLPNRYLTVVVHNIDGPSLRSSDVQLALSKLAAIPNLRFIASVDHVNAPLLWDASMYASFSWVWVLCQTFRPYDAETFFSSKPLFRGGTERRVEGAIALLNSLTERARNVFRDLALRQMQGADEETPASRTTFNELFTSARENFWVSDPETMRNILTELKTHDLLQTRRCADAAEKLWIPLQDVQLEAILNEIGLPS